MIGRSPHQSRTVLPMIELHPASVPKPPTYPEDYDDFERRLICALGVTVGGESLSKALGFRSQDAFRKAHQRGRLPVGTFEIAGRRGRFASTVDIATWLWCQRSRSHGGLAP